MLDPLKEVRAALAGAAFTTSDTMQTIGESFSKTLQQLLEANKQSCARTMITGQTSPNAAQQAQALEQATRSLYGKNQALKLQLAQSSKKEDDQGYTPPRQQMFRS